MNDPQGRTGSRKQNPSKSKYPKNRKGKLRNQNGSSDKPQQVSTSDLRALHESDDQHTLRLKIPTATLPPSFFAIFTSLRVLDLRSVGLKRLPGQIIELKNLEKLDLRYNNLTYLPSQLAELPNLATLQLDDLRDRKTNLLKDLDLTQPENSQLTCSCSPNSHGHLVPPLPTLIQLCTRAIFSSMPLLATDDTGGLSWEELEPIYRSGQRSEIALQLSFVHVLPKTIPFELCSICSEPACPAHARFDKIQTVALRRVLLRYILCSHQCYSVLTEKWEKETIDAKTRWLERESRFRMKEDGIPR